MMAETNSTRAQQQWGFREGWLRRCGERPWRWFVRFGLVLFLAWLAIQLCGTRIRSRPDAPPSPETIPYRAYMPGGSHYESQARQVRLEIDSEAVAPLDPARVDGELGMMTFAAEAKGGLMAIPVIWVWRVGLPWELFHYRVYVEYDVTDPLQAGRKRTYFVGDAALRPLFTCDHERVWRGCRDEAGTVRQYSLEWQRLVWMLAAVELVAIVPVLTLRAAYVLRQRRRARRRQCLNCGHLLDPSLPDRPCPECGSAGRRAQHASATSLPRSCFGALGCSFLSAMTLLVIAWLVTSVLRVTHRDYGPLAERLVKEAELFERVASQGGPSTLGQGSGLITWDASFGWPLTVSFLWDSQQYRWVRGQPIEPWVWRKSGGWGQVDGYLQCRFPTRDPSKSRIVNIYWGELLLTLLGLQLGALLLLVPLRFAAQCAKRGSELVGEPT